MVESIEPAKTVEPTERKLSYTEIAREWGVSVEFVRRLFDDEEGVVKFGHADTRRKRRYYTARVPESVLNRVIAALTVKRGGNRWREKVVPGRAIGATQLQDLKNSLGWRDR